jgi:pimeloyl-ACP methyl ester carboxylesterase
MTGTLTEEQLALRRELRRPVMERWTRRQLEEFAGIWKRWDGSAFLDRTDLPVLELYGDRGRPRPARGSLRLPERDNIELRWIAGASHCLQIEAPAEVARACEEFMRRVEGARGAPAAGEGQR